MLIADPSATVQGGGARATGPLRRTVAFFAVALVLGAFVGRFVFLGSGGAVATDAPMARAGDLDAALAALAADPSDPSLLADVGAVALADARRTGDPALYGVAEDAVSRALAVDPDDVRTLVTAGLLALARHDFTGALSLAERARTVAPLFVDPMAVQIDALVELGRYDDALPLAQEMVSLRPNVSSLPRLSYVLELMGDPDGALDTMQQAVASGGSRGADGAYVLTLLGDLHLQAGRLDPADDAYARALAAQRDQGQAQLGRARVLVARGDLEGAEAVLRPLAERIPLPDVVALRADVSAARGDAAAAAEQRALVRAIEELNRSEGGIAVDLELARFEADHARLADGDAFRAVALAESARGARPTIYGDDTLAWALRKAGRPAEALARSIVATRFGTADPVLWWHRAAIEADLGRLSEAKQHLERSLAISPHGPLVDREERAALAARLGVVLPAPAT